LVFYLGVDMKINKSIQKRENGQNLVEFALILPMLLFVVFGVLDLGRIFFATINLTNAAREGVRYLTLHPDDVDISFGGSKGVAVDEAIYGGIPISVGDVSVTCTNVVDDADSCDSGTPATVSVEYDFNSVLGWITPTIHLSRSATMVIP